MSSGSGEKFYAEARRLAEEDPEQLERLVRHIENKLSELRERISRGKPKVEEVISRTVARYCPNASEEACRQAGYHVASGIGHDLFAEAMHTIKQRAGGEPAGSEAERTIHEGKFRSLNRLVSELYSNLKRSEDLGEKLRHVSRARDDYLYAWPHGASADPASELTDHDRPEAPYHPRTNEYLKVAYRWLEAGNRPKGDRPTEVWQHIRNETGGSLRSIRTVFKKRGWYKTDGEVLLPDGPTQTEHTVNAVLEEGARYFKIEAVMLQARRQRRR